MDANTSPFELLSRATAAMRQRPDLGASTSAAAAEQLQVLQAFLSEAGVELSAWDPAYVKLFGHIQRMVDGQLDILELSERSAGGCRCSHAASAHERSGCLEESWNGPMGFCVCMWPGDVPAARIVISDRQALERSIERVRRGR